MKRTGRQEPLAQRYARDGIVFPIPVMRPEEIAACRSAFEELEAHLDTSIETFRWSPLFFLWAYHLATHAAVDVTLKAGERSLYDFNIIHGSNPNRSDDKRIGFVVRFITCEVEQVGFAVVRVCGQADCSPLDRVKEPPAGSLEERIHAWQAFELQRPAQSQ